MLISFAENVKTLAISTCAHPWLSIIANLVCLIRHDSSCDDISTQQHLCQTTVLAPAATISILAFALFLLLAIIARFLAYFHHWLYTQQGSANLAVSSAVLAQLRNAQPELHPPSRHSFIDVPGAELNNNTPLLCSVCHESISLPTSSATFTACTLCGTAAHPRCARQIGKTCRPIIIGTSGNGQQIPSQKRAQQPHFWLPEGAVYDIDQTTLPSTRNSNDDDDDGRKNDNNSGSNKNGVDDDDDVFQPHDNRTTINNNNTYNNGNNNNNNKPNCCIFCGEPASRASSGGGDVIWGGIAEPTWRCACCARVAHVECYCLAHPDLASVSDMYYTIVGGGGSSGKKPHAVAASPARPSSSTEVIGGRDDISDDDNGTGEGLATNGGSSSGYSSDSEEEDYYYDEQAQHRKRRRRRAAAVQRRLYKVVVPPSSSGSGDVGTENTTIGTGNGTGNGNVSPSQQQQQQQQRSGSPGVVKYCHKDDVCTLGSHRMSIIPACAVRLKSPGNSSNSREVKKGNMTTTNQQQPGMKKSSSSRKLSSKKNKSSSSSSSSGGGGKGGAWWKRAFYSKKHMLDRSDYRILPDLLHPGIKPVLVFINVKSGPCIGESLRQKFLRVLHPLQVVTLPKERPEPALELFARVKGLRILVAGGDGTVGWILGCIDTIFNSNNNNNNNNNNGTYSSSRVWMPPPVAVIPLGTGNDLARCLGWGGGYGTWRQGGVGGILNELNRGSVALLDRWDITVVGERQQISSQDTTGTGTAAGTGNKSQRWRVEAPALTNTNLKKQHQPSIKTMNNYLGIGVDARVALEFHAMRQQHPEWFQSQVGNKMWYTGVGAIDILAKFLRRKMHLPSQSDTDVDNLNSGNNNNGEGKHPGHIKNSSTSTMAALAASHHHLSSTMMLICDGRPVRIPPDADGILIVNIHSYMGGVDLWGTGIEMGTGGGGGMDGGGGMMGVGYDQYYYEQEDGTATSTTSTGGTTNNKSLLRSPRRKQSMYDGVLEVVAVYGSWHLGQLQVGLSRATRVTQASEVSIITTAPLPMQVDGEPFMQQPAELMITLRGQSLMLSRTPGAGPAAEVARAAADVLDAARDRGVLTAAQHAVLTRDMAARVQQFLLQQ